jgi:L-2-hydroxyglutarate oxidase LhgO
MDYEIVIIGGGVVGLACAAELSKYTSSILLVERHHNFGVETSSRNSEVVHAGIYYPEGSLKAQLCAPSNKLLYEWSDKYRVPYHRVGKYIVAVSEEEVEDLDRIKRNANLIGAKEVDFAPIGKVRDEEPHIRAEGALWSPMTGIIDSHSLMDSFQHVAQSNGCDIVWRHKFKEVEKIQSGYNITLVSEDGEVFTVSSEKVINSAGLEADKIANAFGIDIKEAKYELTYVKGNYFRIKSGKKNLAKHLIYPVPAKNLPGLGIHITLDLNGELRLGPDVEYLESNEQVYDVNANLVDKFFESASLYIKGLEKDDLYPDYSGIRPKLSKKGEPQRDFIINEESSKGLPGLLNLIGIESPGLTCSIEISKLVATKLGYTNNV